MIAKFISIIQLIIEYIKNNKDSISQALEYITSPKKIESLESKKDQLIENTSINETITNAEEVIVLMEKNLKDKVLSSEFISEIKKKIFPFTPIQNIKDNWPLIVEALDKKGILDDSMVCYSLSTIKVECEPFKPLSEKPSKFSDSDGIAPFNFSKYDKMTVLGNTPELDGDGEKWKGRGLISITGFNNYKDMDAKLGLDGGLLKNPDAALEIHISAYIFVQFLFDRLPKIQKAFLTKDFNQLRRIVNGGILGLDKFIDAYLKVEKILEDL